jgi:hypothetical protein
MSTLIYSGDIGAKFEVDTANTSAATTTTFSIIVTRPSGATSEWGGIMNYDTGILTYISLAGDLPDGEVGQYIVQVRSVSEDGLEILKSNKDTFHVYKPEF